MTAQPLSPAPTAPPDPDQTAVGEAAAVLTRRSFLKLGIGALAAVAALEAGGATVVYLQSSAAEAELGGVVNAGPATAFPHGSVTQFADSRFFLVRADDGGFLALYRRCPHLGCTIDWEDGRAHFNCPCHASSFDFYGNFDSPPVPRPLDTFDVVIRDGDVLVDTGAARQRSTFSTAQLVYA